MGGSSEGLTWFQWSDLGPDKRPSLAVKYSNWDTTYASLCDALRQQQPDGLFGFSQGATAAALFLAALQTAQRQGRDLDVPLPKFCLVVSVVRRVFGVFVCLCVNQNSRCWGWRQYASLQEALQLLLTVGRSLIGIGQNKTVLLQSCGCGKQAQVLLKQRSSRARWLHCHRCALLCVAVCMVGFSAHVFLALVLQLDLFDLA